MTTIQEELIRYDRGASV